MHVADLMIHLSDTLTPADRSAVETRLRAVAGVVAPRFSTAAPALLLVAYDPATLRSDRLIKEVRRRGYRASGVGL